MTPGTTTVLAIGECMVEVARGTDEARVSHSGDTFNTAVYLARSARSRQVAVDVRYLTGVGDDAESVLMRTRWRDEGISDDAAVIPGRTPGLYIHDHHRCQWGAVVLVLAQRIGCRRHVRRLRVGRSRPRRLRLSLRDHPPTDLRAEPATVGFATCFVETDRHHGCLRQQLPTARMAVDGAGKVGDGRGPQRH